MSAKLTPAVFLDRDGTIIEDRGHLRSPSEVVFFPDTVRALQRLHAHFRLFVVTHQRGIADGIVSSAEVARVNEHTVAELRRRGVVITEVYCCPHRRDEGCVCIKPKPYFLEEAARRYGLDLARSFVVGDHPHDVVLADNAGATGIYVLTGHGAKHRAELPECKAVVPGIREAADWILACREWRLRENDDPGLMTRAADILRHGGVVAFPTETVYGLGAAAFDEKAVARIFEVKRRPRFDPLIVHVSAPEQLPLLVEEVPAAAQALIDRFWPGPLTLVLPRTSAVPDLVTAGLPTVAVRMPRHPVALELIDRAGTPVAAPSANPFGHTSPTTAQHVHDQLAGKVDLVFDGGPCSVGVESTIVSLVSAAPVLLRPGGLSVEDIEAVIGPLGKALRHKRGAAPAPGMLDRHYAPRTPLKLLDRGEAPGAHVCGRVGLLASQAAPCPSSFAAVEVLSANGDLREAAANLFGAMRRLDARGLDCIVAEPVPDSGLGRAINDRLRRSAAPARGD
ncbi:MAG: threonylcarbamoyl-AMP synthase [Lentisphaerae bacterium]|nr:threonylcarbamoyl-AMP synthase [Lentisphaerota bacterium]